jgi:hypothetical protein
LASFAYGENSKNSFLAEAVKRALQGTDKIKLFLQSNFTWIQSFSNTRTSRLSQPVLRGHIKAVKAITPVFKKSLAIFRQCT